MRDITYPSEYGAIFPGRVYTYEEGPTVTQSLWSITQMRREYTRNEPIRLKPTACQFTGRLMCRHPSPYAAWQFRQRDANVTYDAWHYIDLVEGHQLQLTNSDQSRTFAAIYLHENRLYILEAVVPPGAPPPGLFQQSLSFIDEEGNRVRYDSIYTNRPSPGG